MRPPLPPFDVESAAKKARMAEDAWNSRDPERVSLAYTEDSAWRNRSEFFSGRAAIVEFLIRKWTKERDYRLIKEVWAFHENRIAARFAYEYRDENGAWFRAHGNEQWEFDEAGYMRRREHQRRADQGKRAEVLVAVGPAPRGSSGTARTGTVSSPHGSRCEAGESALADSRIIILCRCRASPTSAASLLT